MCSEAAAYWYGYHRARGGRELPKISVDSDYPFGWVQGTMDGEGDELTGAHNPVIGFDAGVHSVYDGKIICAFRLSYDPRYAGCIYVEDPNLIHLDEADYHWCWNAYRPSTRWMEWDEKQQKFV